MEDLSEADPFDVIACNWIATESMTPLQAMYKDFFMEVFNTALAVHLPRAVLSLVLAAESKPAVFKDPVRLPQDVPLSSSGCVTSYIPLSDFEPELKEFDRRCDCLVHELKGGMEWFVCRPDNPFREQKVKGKFVGLHFCDYTGEQYLSRYLPRQDRSQLPRVQYPYEVSAVDDSFVGIDGAIVDYQCLPYMLRRCFWILGHALRQLQEFRSRLHSIIDKRASERNFNGRKVKALYVGGFVEAVMLYTGLLEDIDSFNSRLHHSDPVLYYHHGVWDLKLPYNAHFVHMIYPEKFDNLDSFEPLPGSGEWNEYLGRWDSLDEKHQRFIIILKQMYPFLVATQRMYLELLGLLDTNEFPAFDDGEPLLKKDTVRRFLHTVPAIMNRMKLAVKHRVDAVLPCSLEFPDSMVFPNEYYRQSRGVLPHYLEEVGFEPELRALCLAGSAICVAFHAFRAIGAAFNGCRGLNKTYRREGTNVRVFLSDSFVVARFKAAMEERLVDHVMKDVHCQFMHSSATYDHDDYPARHWVDTVFPHGIDWNDRVARLLEDGTYPANL
jgi:hypothetical protein